MKRNRQSLLITFWLLILSMATCIVPAHGKTYKVNKVCKTDPWLMIMSVTIDSEKTLVNMKYELPEDMPKDKERTMGVYPPGHDMAFFITDVRNAKKYYLLDVEGVAIRPNKNILKNKGDRVEFTLIFQRIPMKHFHMIEGKLPTDEGAAWHFTNVKLQ